MDSAKPGKGGRILVVDDEPMVLELTKRILERKGYATLGAESGEEAIDAVARERSDLVCVILDLTMPGLAGVELLRRIKDEAPELEVIVMSGYSKAHVEEEMSALPFLHKPFSGTDLTDIVAATLAR